MVEFFSLKRTNESIEILRERQSDDTHQQKQISITKIPCLTANLMQIEDIPKDMMFQLAKWGVKKKEVISALPWCQSPGSKLTIPIIYDCVMSQRESSLKKKPKTKGHKTHKHKHKRKHKSKNKIEDTSTEYEPAPTIGLKVCCVCNFSFQIFE